MFSTYSLKLQEHKTHLSTGCLRLDSLLQGGLNIGGFIEVCGLPGTGKWDINK